MNRALDMAIHELEEAAARLRGDSLDSATAADLVERCADIAATIGAELERAGREAEREGPASGQEQLL